MDIKKDFTLKIKPKRVIVLTILVLFSLHGAQGVSFQLWKGGDHDGLLRVYKTDWLVTCSTSMAFSTKEASILCRGLSSSNPRGILVNYEHYLVGNETIEGMDTVSLSFKCSGSETSFSQCVNDSTIGVPINDSCIIGIGVLCTNQAPSFKHISEDNRVETLVNSSWTGICADSFRYREANVTCKTLNKPWTDARPLRIKNKLRSSLSVGDVRCAGSEDSLNQCSGFIFGFPECPEKREAGVYCAEASPHKFRLMNGSSLSDGRLEMWYEKRWGSVCGKGSFSNKEAQVLCRSLNLEFSSARVVPIDMYGMGTDAIWIKNVNCTGTEAGLLSCQRHFTGAVVGDPCTHFDDVAISCEGHRITNSQLEVSYQGHWMKIYGDKFNKIMATVACRALGLPRSGLEFKIVDASETYVGDLLALRSCVGTEDSLFDCDYDWEDPLQLRQDTMSVTVVELDCKAADSRRLQFRHPGDDKMGLYEVNAGSNWGTICGNGLGANEVGVACRHLGFSSSFAAILPTSYTPTGNGSVLMGGIVCGGAERSLAECNYNPINVVSCDKAHRDDLNIYCGSIEDNFHVRLAGSEQKHAGRVEVKLYGSWGTVCDDGFDFNAAKVICRQLDLPISEPRTTPLFQAGTGRVWLRGVNCTGEEDSIRDCRFSPIIAPSDCSHSEDIGVVCSGTVVPVDEGLSGGAIAGIIIAILLVFVLLGIALCVLIKKWSAARRDLGSNLLKANGKSGDTRVEYNHDAGMVNVAFNDSPNASEDRRENGLTNPVRKQSSNQSYQAPFVPVGLNGKPNYYTETSENYSEDNPPAYHSIGVQDHKGYNKPNYRPGAYARGEELEKAPSTIDNTAPINSRVAGRQARPHYSNQPSPNVTDNSKYEWTDRPDSDGRHSTGGSHSAYNPPSYEGRSPNYPRSPDLIPTNMSHGRSQYNNWPPGGTQNPSDGRLGYSKPRGSHNENFGQSDVPSPTYRGNENFGQNDVPSTTYRGVNSQQPPEPSPTRRVELPRSYGQIDIPEATSV